MSHKKSRMKTSKLSSSVLDYYYKYGQNRDLEKYLRMKRSASKSSSDSSSLKNYESGSYSSEGRKNTKSMEKLDLDDSKWKSKDNSEQRSSKSTENVCETGDGFKEKRSANEKNPIIIEKKTQQQFKGKSKSKSYNFNLESSIEINLPSSTSLPTLPTTNIDDSTSKPTRILRLESSETQTEALDVKQIVQPTIAIDPSVGGSAVTTKIVSERNKNVAQENILETSPASSVASAKVRLEWDSMADIGYNRIIDFKSQSNSNLTTFEKSALTKFFAKRGLNFEDNLLILAPSDTKSVLQKREFTQSAIEMRDAQKIQKDLPNLSPSTSKRLWEKALEKYRDKYRHSKPDATNAEDTAQCMSFSVAPHHSTPLPINTSNSNRFNDESINQPSHKSIEKTPIKNPATLERFEKWSQTSSIEVEAIGIQVEQPQIVHMSKSVQIEIEQSHETTQKDDDDLTTATSFEFLAPSVYKNQHNKFKEKSANESAASEIPSRNGKRDESVYIHDDNPDDKENIPPIDDKENVPPPPLHAMHRNDRPSDYKTPENTIKKRNESCVLPNDLQKGVDLINALIDSRTTNSATKNKLIRKIVRHLLKSRDTKDITQMIMSFSDKSNTKISGISSMEESEQSDIGKATKDNISGVSVLSSSSSLASASVPDPMSENIEQELDRHSDGVEKLKENVERKKDRNDNIDNKKKELQKEKAIETTPLKFPEEIAHEKEIKDWLLPVTQSEIEKEIARKSQAFQIVDTVDSERKNIPSEQRTSGQSKATDKKTKNNEILEFLEIEKKTHFNWIDQEIKHLNNLKSLLENIKTNGTDSDESKGNASEEKINSVYAKHNREYLSIYENFRRLAKHSSVNASQADVSSTLIDSSKSSEDNSRALNHGKMGSKSHWIHKTTLKSPPSTISSGSKVKDLSKESTKQPIKSNLPHENPEWDSHLNMQQLVKNRTKLKTPNSDDSIEAYAKACRAEFDIKCAKFKIEPGKKMPGKYSVRDQPIYTKPYSSDSYSDMQNLLHLRSKKSHKKGKSSDAYTTVSSSDGFLSPNSISIGVAANSTSNTTTHQYDTKISVGIQTSNTLERMPVIQLKKSIEEIKEPEKSSEKFTARVKKLMINRQLQVRPEALAYIIMFKENENNKQQANLKASMGNPAKHIPSSIDSDSSNKKHVNPSNAREKTTQCKGRSSSNIELSSIVSADDNLTLQEYLRARRPDFYANAEQRRKCLNDLHNLRQQRNEQRKKLFSMNICTNAKTLNRNMKRLLPPPPLAQMRIFKSKEIIRQTRRKYQKLPEILKRQQMERDMKIRRNHRILVNMFSKNLQKIVLSGKTDLSNSMMIN